MAMAVHFLGQTPLALQQLKNCTVHRNSFIQFFEGWIRGAWKLTEDELLSLSGLDGVVFIRIIVFCLKVFSFAGIIGFFILLTINCSGDQLEEFSLANISSDSLDIFTISNVDSGSKSHISLQY